MTAQPCIHGLAGGCADCAPRPRQQKMRGRTAPGFWLDEAAEFAELYELAQSADDGLGPAIEARFAGNCRACGAAWEPGDTIVRSDDEDGWVCATCAYS